MGDQKIDEISLVDTQVVQDRIEEVELELELNFQYQQGMG